MAIFSRMCCRGVACAHYFVVHLFGQFSEFKGSFPGFAVERSPVHTALSCISSEDSRKFNCQRIFACCCAWLAVKRVDDGFRTNKLLWIPQHPRQIACTVQVAGLLLESLVTYHSMELENSPSTCARAKQYNYHVTSKKMIASRRVSCDEIFNQW